MASGQFTSVQMGFSSTKIRLIAKKKYPADVKVSNSHNDEVNSTSLRKRQSQTLMELYCFCLTVNSIWGDGTTTPNRRKIREKKANAIIMIIFSVIKSLSDSF